MTEDEQTIAAAYSRQSNNGFDLAELSRIRSFAGRVRYCRQYLQYIGRGSSRMAFSMPNGHVLKLAFNQKGLAQNRAEAGDYYKSGLYCFTESYHLADDDTWVESELAQKCRKTDFLRIMGIPFDTICDFIIYLTRERGTGREFRFHMLRTDEEKLKELEQTMYDRSDDDPNYRVLYELNDYIGNYGASETIVSDFFRIANWGKVVRDNREVLVITDSGLDEDVWQNHYGGRRNV